MGELKLVIEVAVPLPSLTNMREHPMARAGRVAVVHNIVGTALAAQPVPQSYLLNDGQVLIVRLTRLAPAMLDDDNLASSLKAARDAFAEWLGVDDRKHLRVRYFPYQAKRPKVVIPKSGKQRKDRSYQTLLIEAEPVRVYPPAGAKLERLKRDAELAVLFYEAAEGVVKEVKSSGDLEAALASWLGLAEDESTFSP